MSKRKGKQDSIKQLSIPPIYINCSFLVTCTEGLHSRYCTKLDLAKTFSYPTPGYMFMSLFVTSRCMFELTFAIDHRAVKNLSMQYGLKNHRPMHLFKHQVNMDWQSQTALHVSLHTDHNSNSAILNNDYASFLFTTNHLCTGMPWPITDKDIQCKQHSSACTR